MKSDEYVQPLPERVKSMHDALRGALQLDAVMAPAQAFGEGWWLSPV